MQRIVPSMLRFAQKERIIDRVGLAEERNKKNCGEQDSRRGVSKNGAPRGSDGFLVVESHFCIVRVPLVEE